MKCGCVGAERLRLGSRSVHYGPTWRRGNAHQKQMEERQRPGSATAARQSAKTARRCRPVPQ